MPFTILHRIGDNPLSATRSIKNSKKSQQNFVLAIVPPECHPDPEFWAHVTRFTGQTVLGTQAAQECGVQDGGNLEVHLICEYGNDYHHFGPIQLKVSVADRVPPDYFQLGWAVIEKYFDEERSDADGDLHLKVKTQFAALCRNVGV